MVKEEGWKLLREWVNSWLVRNHWDVEVTQSVWKGLDWMDHNHQLVLVGLITFSSFHLLSSLLLIIGTILSKHNLLIPWIIIDIVIIIIMIPVFTTFTFISFFVDLLIGIVFPVVGGLLLGVWIVLWRNAWRFYHQTNQPPKLSNQDSDYSISGLTK